MYLEWLESVCGGQGVQRMDYRRPAGWYEALQSSAHVRLRPPCSPNPAADTPDPPEECLQTSHSENKRYIYNELMSKSLLTEFYINMLPMYD